jgi:hypothetical protein
VVSSTAERKQRQQQNRDSTKRHNPQSSQSL